MIKSTIAFGLTLALVSICSPRGMFAAAEPPPFLTADLSPGKIAELKEKNRTVLSLEDSNLLDLIPVESGGIFFTDCPNCDHGRQDRGQFEWSIKKPFHITCEGCGEIYPDNDKYPENEQVEVEHSTGTHRLAFYQDSSSGKQFFFSAHADYWRRMHLEQSAKQLAQLYSATGESRFAHRSALILAGFAEVYPNYVLTYDFPFRPVRFASPEEKTIPNVPIYRTSKRTWWGINEVSVDLTEAYDLIKSWDGWAELPVSQSRHKVREDLLFGMMRFVLDTENWERSTHQPRVGKLLVARTLGNPEAVHESIRRFKRLSQRFYHDGQYNIASPSYSQQMMNTLNRWIQATAGYTDPAGHVDPFDGNRFEDLDLSKLPFIQNFTGAYYSMAFPDGRLLPINDTWASSARTSKIEPLEAVSPTLFPGIGFGFLGGGSGKDQWLLYLNTTGGPVHKHHDALSIGLYWNEQEWLSDIGYTHTRMRPWAKSTMAHSTVVVNGRESDVDKNSERITPTLFEARDPEFQIIGAEAPLAYGDRVDSYQRMLAAHADGDGSLIYFIDWFNVSGYSQADYILLGPLSNEATVSSHDLTGTPFHGNLMNAGVEFRQPKGESDQIGPEAAFGFFDSLFEFIPLESTHFEFMAHTNRDEKLVAWMDTTSVDRVYSARVPSVREAGENDANLAAFDAPALVWRRGSDSNAAGFTSVIAPSKDKQTVLEVAFPKNNAPLTVYLDNGSRHVWFLRAVNGPDMFFDGSAALIIYGPEAELKSIQMLGGSRLTFGDREYQGPGNGAGLCVEIFPAGEDEGFVLEGSLPSNPSKLLTLFFADGTSRGYTIKTITPLGTERHHVKVNEEIGLRIEGASLISTRFPLWEKSSEPIRYLISGHYKASPESTPAETGNN